MRVYLAGWPPEKQREQFEGIMKLHLAQSYPEAWGGAWPRRERLCAFIYPLAGANRTLRTP